jgi:hypothetical protein
MADPLAASEDRIHARFACATVSGAHSAEERWRHAWAAFVLGAIAVIALGLIAFVLTTRPAAAPNAHTPLFLTEVPTHPSTSAPHSTSSGRPRTSAQPSAATSTTAVPSTTAAASTTAPSTSARVVVQPTRPAHRANAGPCGRSASCVVGGTGAVQAALAGYRRAHGVDGNVSAFVTEAAQRCALTHGDGPSCADPFAVAREGEQSGSRAIGDIGAGYGNWLLDPGLQAVEVGWAYDSRTALYVCVLIARM